MIVKFWSDPDTAIDIEWDTCRDEEEAFSEIPPLELHSVRRVGCHLERETQRLDINLPTSLLNILWW